MVSESTSADLRSVAWERGRRYAAWVATFAKQGNPGSIAKHSTAPQGNEVSKEVNYVPDHEELIMQGPNGMW